VKQDIEISRISLSVRSRYTAIRLSESRPAQSCNTSQAGISWPPGPTRRSSNRRGDQRHVVLLLAGHVASVEPDRRQFASTRRRKCRKTMLPFLPILIERPAGSVAPRLSTRRD
jgi:hypothetical protein